MAPHGVFRWMTIYLTGYGVKQGGVPSPTLFAIFINSLLDEVKGANVGVDVGDLKSLYCCTLMT